MRDPTAKQRRIFYIAAESNLMHSIDGYVHCHVNDHITTGMRALYRVW